MIKKKITREQLFDCFFEIINPYSLNKQGNDTGLKYRTGIYSKDIQHLVDAKKFIRNKEKSLNVSSKKIVVEVMFLQNYLKSEEKHQFRLMYFPNDYCHLPRSLVHKYKNNFNC